MPIPQPTRDLLTSDRWLAIDTETTGRDDHAEVVEIAIVDAGGGLRFRSLVRPFGSVSPGAERIHGLSRERLASAPKLSDLYSTLARLLTDRQVFAYHAPFDRRVLATSCRRVGLSAFAISWHCALDLYAHVRGFRPTLSIACEVEGVEMGEVRHRAAADAVALQRLLVKLKGAVTQQS